MPDVGPALRAELRGGKLSPEARRRAEWVLGSPTELPPRLLRARRAVQVLEYAGTPGAKRVLEQLAGGAKGARLAEQAPAALARLSRRGP